MSNHRARQTRYHRVLAQSSQPTSRGYGKSSIGCLEGGIHCSCDYCAYREPVPNHIASHGRFERKSPYTPGTRWLPLELLDDEDVKRDRNISARPVPDQVGSHHSPPQLGSLACSILRTFAFCFLSFKQSQTDDHFVFVVFPRRSMPSAA